MSGVILTGESMYRHPRGGWDDRPAAEWAWLKHPPTEERIAMIGVLERLGKTDLTVKVLAHVNHGRWVAVCPFCGSSQVATVTDRRFLCAGANACANSAIGGAFVQVVWPSDRDRVRIEELLLEVSDIGLRNWNPSETVEQLRSQLELHVIATGSG